MGPRLAGGDTGPWGDARPRAFIALSPPGPNQGVVAEDYARCTRPMLVMTGSDDQQPAWLAPAGAERSGLWRRQVFDLLPPGGKLLAWFEGSRHSTYAGGGRGAGAGLTREPADDPAQVEAVAVITLAWWDARLRADAAAAAWLADPSTPMAVGPWARFEAR
jgi:hypothetical protein